MHTAYTLSLPSGCALASPLRVRERRRYLVLELLPAPVAQLMRHADYKAILLLCEGLSLGIPVLEFQMQPRVGVLLDLALDLLACAQVQLSVLDALLARLTDASHSTHSTCTAQIRHRHTTHRNTYTHTPIHIYTYTCTHIHMHTHAHTHTHNHKQTTRTAHAPHT